MLVTTCPECGTTFRVSVGILEKADGQVRCGRCATIFDANVRLRQLEDRQFRTRPSPLPEVEPKPGDEPAAAAPEEPAPPTETVTETETETQTETETETEPTPIAGAAELETEPATPVAAARPSPEAADEAAGVFSDWRPLEPDSPPRHWGWTAGTMLLIVSLLGQVTYLFRAELVNVPLVGSALAGVYDRLGSAPVSTDIDQYDLLDLTSVAEPTAEEQGWLLIETRVHNRGPKVQPYPYIFVRLLDRWEDTIAGRYFGPEEYAVNPIDDSAHMTAGRTIDAQFIIMDPGPSATGFELELCMRVDDGYLCESDFTDD